MDSAGWGFGKIWENSRKGYGRRDVEVLGAADEEGYTKNFPQERRKLLGKWFVDCAKGNRPVGKDVEVKILWALEEAMGEVGK